MFGLAEVVSGGTRWCETDEMAACVRPGADQCQAWLRQWRQKVLPYVIFGNHAICFSVIGMKERETHTENVY